MDFKEECQSSSKVCPHSFGLFCCRLGKSAHESKFNLFSSDGIRYVRRPPGQRNNPKYQVPTVKRGGGYVMIWGAFSRDDVGPLVRVEGTMYAKNYKKILEDNMIEFAITRLDADWIFQQDNDPKHTPKVLKAWFADEKVQVLEWPSQSPDLNLLLNSYNKSVDMWIIGVIIYVTLSGSFPFDEGEDVALQVENEACFFPADPWSKISRSACELIKSLLRIQIAERLTIEGCLAHEWLRDAEVREELLNLERRLGVGHYLTSVGQSLHLSSSKRPRRA